MFKSLEYKRFNKRIVALLAAVTVMAGAFPLMGRLLQAEAAEEDVLIPKVADLTDNYWVDSDRLRLTDLAGGGVHIEWRDAVTNVRVGVRKTAPLDGMVLRLANLTAGANSNGNFAVLLGNGVDTTYDGDGDKDTPALLFDTGNGQVLAMPGNHVVVSQNDALKYDNLQGKPLEIRTKKGAEGAYDVTISVDGTLCAGTLPAAALTPLTGFDPAKDTAAVLTAWRFDWDTPSTQNLSVDLMGFGKEPPAADDKISAPTAAEMTDNYWAGGMLGLTNLPDGGVKIDWKDAVLNVRAGVKKAVPLDGLTMRLNNLTAADPSRVNFGILLGNQLGDGCDEYEVGDTNTLALVFNAFGGSLLAAPGDQTVLTQNDALKYENLTGKALEIRINKGADGLYAVTLSVNGTDYSGTIPAEVFAAAPGFDPAKDVYALLTMWRFPWDDPATQSMSVEYTGFGSDPIDAPPVDPTPDYPRPKVEAMTPNYWESMLGLTDLPDGGVKIDWKDAVVNVRAGVNKAVPFDGMVMQLNNLTAADPSRVNFGILLGNRLEGGCDEYSGGDDTNTLALVFNAGGGSLLAAPSDKTVITQNDALKYENLKGKALEIRVKKGTDGLYAVTLRVDGTDYSGTIPAEVFAAVPGFDPTKDVYALLTVWRFSWDNPATQSMSVEYTGFGSDTPPEEEVDREKVEAAIEAIDAIGTVALDNGAPIRLARKAYDALTAAEKALVTNSDALTAAEAAYTALTNAADENLTPLNRAKGLLSSSPEGYVQNTINNDWKNFIKLTDLPGGRGLRYRFTSAPTNVREGYAADVDMDGLLLQFDNFDREDDASGEFALFFADTTTRPYGGSYEESQKALAIVFNLHEGSVKAYPSEELILQDEALTYASMANRRWSVALEETEEEDYTLTVKVGSKSVSGTLPKAAIQQSAILTAPSQCVMSLSSWGQSQSFSLDFLGVGALYDASEVIGLIDAIGLVTLDSGDVIAAAETAYDALHPKAQAAVFNHDILIQSRRYFDSLDAGRMVASAIELIDEIGEVTVLSGDKVMEAEDMVSRLTAAQRAKVTNLGKLEQAVERFYTLMAPYMPVESILYGPGHGAALSIDESMMAEWWKDGITAAYSDDYRLRLSWKNAVRNMRTGPAATYNLNGLYLQLANITKDEGREGARLAVMFGNGISTEYNPDGGLYALAVVLDTETGAIRAFPTGETILRSDALKQANIEGKMIGFKFLQTDEGLTQLQVFTGAQRLIGIIPSRALAQANCLKDTEQCNVVLTCWTDQESELTDGSRHTFSAELVSVQDTGGFAYESLLAVVSAIDELPDKATEDNADRILEVNEAYMALPRALRKQVSNYDKLAKLLAQVNELLYSAEGETPAVPEDPDGPKDPENPDDPSEPVPTGVEGSGWLVGAALLPAVILLAISRGRRTRKEREDG